MDFKEFESQFLNRLNAQQREAVLAVDGPILLLATPGSGKTTVLVTRLGYMTLIRGIAHRSILTMTYTVAATGDMKSRFAAFFGERAAEEMQFRTINGVSESIIKYAARNHVGRTPFELQTDDGELKHLIRGIYQSVNDGYPEDSEINEIRRLITFIKNNMLTDEEIGKLDSSIDKIPEIYRRYKDALRSRQWMDYDDQMSYAYAILKKYPQVLEHFQTIYPYLCVDEAQDTSRIQHEIIKLLASKTENLFMVGDEDQSIYGFRAAYPEALLHFEQDHPNARILLMEENYRSSREIVAAANRFVAENQFRRKKTIVPTRPSGSPVHLVRAKSREHQFLYLVAMARHCSGETAILFRNNDTALPLIDLLERAGLTYNCKNIDELFFSHRVVIDILDIIRFAYEPRNVELFMRLYYKFGTPISKKSAQYAVERCRNSKKTLLEELMHAPDVRGPVQDVVIDLMGHLPALQTDSAETAIHRIWEAMHYGWYVEQKKLDVGKYFILGMLAKGIDSPRAFLTKLDTLRETLAQHQNDPGNRLILSTIHSSKGLEYDTVYLADVIDGILPSKTASEAQSIEEIKLYEEERRLYYVGMTRAKNDLYLFSCGETSGFTSEVTRALPTPVVDPDDVFTPLLVPKVGKVFQDQKFGRGEIVAECEGQNLISFRDGQLEILSLEEMLKRRNKTVEYAVQPSKSETPAANGKLWQDAASAYLLSQLHVGSTVLHKSFGEGKILSIQDDVLTADFGAKGVRRLGLTLSIQNKLIGI